MTGPLTDEQLAGMPERGPVGYHCDHSDEPPFNARTHHDWEYVDGEGYVFQHMPDTVRALSFPRGYLSPEQQAERCPRAVPVYAVDVPALAAEVERLHALLASQQEEANASLRKLADENRRLRYAQNVLKATLTHNLDAADCQLREARQAELSPCQRKAPEPHETCAACELLARLDAQTDTTGSAE
ncbi:hypothetical protein IMZ11_02690 [Microtetraspora sp. AC03309]|uniref:hypothetical protein n=1 Tax=Microtetraspora sp. AC03309 TaxID=2779376 RepID=UPI001E2AD04F|nr:hypothetical protein [Microtetraspora sp. AC03309]MCC5574547.1 hypothetical protein [Microtetraspora sp. AC03309]